MDTDLQSISLFDLYDSQGDQCLFLPLLQFSDIDFSLAYHQADFPLNIKDLLITDSGNRLEPPDVAARLELPARDAESGQAKVGKRP